MPIIKWAKKALKQSEKRQQKNSFYKGIYTETRKIFEKAIRDKDLEAAKKVWANEKVEDSNTKSWVRNVRSWLQSIIDKLVKKNIIHRNNASRKKAKFSKMLKELALN